jgi:hypothetical protein
MRVMRTESNLRVSVPCTLPLASAGQAMVRVTTTDTVANHANARP